MCNLLVLHDEKELPSRSRLVVDPGRILEELVVRCILGKDVHNGTDCHECDLLPGKRVYAASRV